MSEIRLTVSDETMAQLRERVSESGCDSPEAYVQGLLQKDLAPDYDEDLEALLLERADGPWVEWTPELAEKLQAEFLSTLKAKAKS